VRRLLAAVLLVAAAAAGVAVLLLVGRPGPAVSFERVAGGYRFVNGDGAWTILTSCRRGAGPGYVARLVTARGVLLVDDERGPGVLNDPRFGGLGAFGWHAARGRPGRLRLGVDSAWDVSGRGCIPARVVEPPRRTGGAVTFGIDVLPGGGAVRVSYRYRFERSGVHAWLLVEQRCPHGICGPGGRAFVKEPKLVVSIANLGPRFRRTATFGADGRLVCVSRVLGPAQGPILRTGQCEAPARARVRFDYGSAASGSRGGCARRPCFNVVMRAWDARAGALPWQNGRAGLDAWAVASARRQAAFHRDTGSIDGVRWGCHGGSPAASLQRRWEASGRRDEHGRILVLGMLFPAWEGGRGAYDCEPLSRLFGPAGERFAVFASYSVGPGWRLDAPPPILPGDDS
jgi:hypothetical protein